MTTVNPGRLGDALRVGACGIHPLEAGTSLLIDCGNWLHRTDFTSRFITTGTSISDGVTLLASIDWEAAVTALHAGELPASGGELDPHRFRRHHPKWHDGLRGENRMWDRLARSTPRNIRTRLWNW